MKRCPIYRASPTPIVTILLTAKTRSKQNNRSTSGTSERQRMKLTRSSDEGARKHTQGQIPRWWRGCAKLSVDCVTVKNGTELCLLTISLLAGSKL